MGVNIMTELEKADSVAPETTDSVVDQENVQELDAATSASDTVKYETYLRKKKLAENERKARIQAEVERSDLQQRLLEAEGKKDEQIQYLKKQIDELSTEKKKLYGNFAYTSLNNQITAEASKLGCVDAEALVRLMDVDTFMDSLDTETFRANPDEIKMAIEKQKKKRAYLFDKQGPKINTSNPNVEFNQKKRLVADMSVDEQQRLAKEIDAMEGKGLGKPYFK
jgi:hypothetical protein